MTNRAMAKGMLRIDMVFVDFPNSQGQVYQNVIIKILIHNDKRVFPLRGV